MGGGRRQGLTGWSSSACATSRARAERRFSSVRRRRGCRLADDHIHHAAVFRLVRTHPVVALMSCEIWSSDWPVPVAISSFSRAFSRRISRRALSMSAAMPCTPAEAWWMRMRTACLWHPPRAPHPCWRQSRCARLRPGAGSGAWCRIWPVRRPAHHRGVEVHLNLVVGVALGQVQ